MQFRPIPYATASVFVLTAVPTTLGLLAGDGAHRFWRYPDAVRDGEWWRLATSLVLQDGGVVGAVFNLACLLIVGVVVERALGPARWLLLYLAGAVAGQVAGVLFGTVGAGNSIAICGLAGGLLGVYARRGVDRLPATVCAVYAAVIVSTQFGGTAAGVVAAVATGLGIQLVRLRDKVPGWLPPVIALGCAAFLAVVGNLHGVALLGGGLVGLLLPAPNRPDRPDRRAEAAVRA